MLLIGVFVAGDYSRAVPCSAFLGPHSNSGSCGTSVCSHRFLSSSVALNSRIIVYTRMLLPHLSTFAKVSSMTHSCLTWISLLHGSSSSSTPLRLKLTAEVLGPLSDTFKSKLSPLSPWSRTQARALLPSITPVSCHSFLTHCKMQMVQSIES
jgi:hypothetical protein